MIVPFSLGIPFGLLLVLAGIIVFFATRYKLVGILVFGFGAAIAAGTLILIVLIVNSQM